MGLFDIPDDDEQDDLKQRPAIAPPSTGTTAIPPLNLPGVSPQTAQRTSGDQTELNRLADTGSGISQLQRGSPASGAGIAKPHPILGGILRGLDTLGTIVAPKIMSGIPGTSMHHQALENQEIGKVGNDVDQGNKEAQTVEAGARTGQANAAAAHDTAETDALKNPQPKPKEEEWSVVPNMAGPNGEPVQQEKNSGQIRFAPNVSGVGPVKTPAEKPDTPEQQFVDEFQRTHPHGTIAQAVAAYSAATQKPDRPEKPQRQLGIQNGKIVEITPGMDAAGVQSIGGEEKAGATAQAGQDALNYAKDYMSGGKFTGAGDEALMEKYFELAKPSSGFRMTQAQIEMLQYARDLMGGTVAKAKHLFTPEAPYFSDTQRQQIVDTMNSLENAKGKSGTASPPTKGTEAPEGTVIQVGNQKQIKKDGKWVAQQ
jgi:hypothetical protein